jgi:hypothetical protein
MTTPTPQVPSHRPTRKAPPRARQLSTGAVYGVSIERPTSVTCVMGELWVTGPHTGDQILEAGQRLTISGPGRIVIEALVPAAFRVTARVSGREP